MILKFPTASHRTAFIDRLYRSEPDLIEYAKPSYSQTDVIIVKSRDRAVLRRFKTMSNDIAVAHDDVQFETMGAG